MRKLRIVLPTCVCLFISSPCECDFLWSDKLWGSFRREGLIWKRARDRDRNTDNETKRKRELAIFMVIT